MALYTGRFAHTPIQQVGDILLKRDDLFEMAGIRGGKVRACYHLTTLRETPAEGLITASARKSPQAQIVARIAAHLGIPARCHMPTGQVTEEMEDMLAHGAELVQHKAGYNNVIISRAKQDAAQRPAWQYIPFGMEHREAVRCTRNQVHSIEHEVKVNGLPMPKRIIIPIGSGMSAAGVLHGLRDRRLNIPVIGVRVGADPAKRLNTWAPFGWRAMMKIIDVTDRIPYHQQVEAKVGDVLLDPIYEAKCLEYVGRHDLLWCVGIRATASTKTNK